MGFSRFKKSCAVILLLGIACANFAQADQTVGAPHVRNEARPDCVPISSLTSPAKMQRTANIVKSANYCLTQDLTASTSLVLIHPEAGFFVSEVQPGWFDAMISISTSDVVVDLKGNTLRSESRKVSGVKAVSWVDANLAGHNFDGLLKNITVRNGKININSDRKLGFHSEAIRIVNGSVGVYDNPHELRPEKIGSWAKYYASRDGYASTNFVLENLEITSDHDAPIFLQGNNNIIRNCKIRVKGSNAIQIFGNNVQILNNEIIVEVTEKIGSSSVPIMLRDGDNALISGNKITIEGDERSRPVQAISLRDSRNVRIENNKIIGAQTIYKAFEPFTAESTVIESNNSLKTKAGLFD